MAMDLTAQRRHFPVTERWIYLNHAAVAPLSRPAARAMGEQIADAESNGLVHIDTWNALYREARQSVARLIGARSADISFQKNTTDGLLTVANGLDWRPGDAVVLPEGEFPANVYPWLNLSTRDVEVRRVPLRGARLHVDDVAAAMDAHVRVVSVSSVSFFCGFRCDLAPLSQLCRDCDALFVVDGIQSVGALATAVTDWGVDCLAADGHKWLMGPEGCAFLYTSPRARDRLQVANLGWGSVATAYDFLDCDTRLQPDARRYETGTQNTAGIAGLKAAIDLLASVGADQVEARVMALTDRLCAGLNRRGFSLLSPRAPGEGSGIVTFRSATCDSGELDARLRQAGIVATDRGGCLRFSPHFYNTEDEIDAALEALPAGD